MAFNSRRLIGAVALLVILPRIAGATTIITNTRTEVATMGGLWEVDSVQISPLANAQYPQFTNTWEYISPSGSKAADGDEHLNMAVTISGTGTTSGNQGESPIVSEIINASQLLGSTIVHAKTRGIFRYYTEHASERKFEIHPMTEVDTWTGSNFVLFADYRTNITFDANGTTHAASTLQQMFTQNMTAKVMADNTNVIFTFTSPNTNYGQFDGKAQSGVLNDSVSSYFLFTPTNPAVATTVRCRLVANTAAAFNATGLSSNQAVTVNILTRWDMLAISNKVASLTAGGSSTFSAPVEFITLGVSSTGIVSSLPVISNIQVANLATNSATIQWTTDAASDSRVSYGLSAATDTNVVSVSGNVTAHSVNLTGLQSGTTYFFNVSSTSTGGTTIDDNQGVDYTFTTLSLQSIQTVFVIPMENMNWSSVRGSSSAPYINNTLLPMASHAEQYFNPTGLHPSLPNYLWLEAGTNFGITSDLLPSSAHQSTTNHFVTLLKNAGITWRSYDEDICGCLCPLANTNSYVPRHNPFVYFDDVTNTNNANSANCIAHDVAYSTLAGDLQSNTVARYNWVVPNLCDDMHNSCSPTNNNLAQGDGWLSRELPKILNSQAYSNNGAIFIVWDEGAGSSDGPIGMIVISPLAKGGGYSNTVHYTHSSTLKTFQEIFNVGPLLGDAANATDLSDLFNVSAGTAQLGVSPSSGLTSSGTAGGPFSPNSQIYTLTNSGGAALSWTASETVNWLTLSATSGTLAPGAGTTVTVSINANANSLAANSYSDTVSFANTTNGAGNTTRAVNLTVNSPAALSASPATGLTSSGTVGGPFSPSGQTYALTNSGGATLNWTVSKSANWLTLSATSGTLAGGGSTNITVSINANANSLAANSYSDTVSFTNTTNGAGNTTRAVNLTVNSPAALSVSPVTGLTSSGTVGGPFSPSGQTYALTNSGGATLNWTASKTANWLTLSATSGALAGGASTTITVSINSSANSLSAGGYSDTVSFTNTTNGAGNTTRAVSLIVSSLDPSLPVITGVQLNSPATQMKVTIQWTTDLSTGSKVLFGTSPSSVTNLVSVAGTNTSHSVKLTGLAPGTVYYYEVISASSTNDNQGALYTFTTTSPCPCQ